MKLSELIKQMQDYVSENGDLYVYVRDADLNIMRQPDPMFCEYIDQSHIELML